MRRFLIVLPVFLLSLALAACAGAAVAVTIPPQTDNPQPTLTSVFEPMLTPTLTPYTDTPAVVIPPADANPGLPLPEISTGEVITPTNINFIDPLVGWATVEFTDTAVSGLILRTEDGASTWSVVNPPSGFPHQSRFFALDALHAWVEQANFVPGQEVSTATVLRSADGGQTWQPSDPINLTIQDQPVVEYNIPQSIFFLDEQHGWLVLSVGHYMNQDVLEIFSTQDGGQTWQRTADKFSMGQPGNEAMPCLVSSVAFVDPQHGFLAGNCLAVGVNDSWSILESKDGGHTWQRTQLPEPAGVTDVIRNGMKNNTTMCAAMDVSLEPAGVLLSYACQLMENDGGMKTYPFLFLSPDGSTWHGWSAQAASFVDSSHGFSLGPLSQAGAHEFSATTDGGMSWQAVTVVTWPEASLDFQSTSEGYVLARGWNETRGAYDYALVRTLNGGKSWDFVKGTLK